MTPELSHAAAGLADLAHTLESGDEPDIRLPRAVERIRLLLESDACACASTASPLAPSVVVAPSVPAAEEVRLGRDAVALLQVVLDRGERGARGASGRAGGGRPHLAMPLIALGEVVGTILVEREGEPYRDADLQLLAIAASQLGAYLAVVRARDAQRRSEAALSEALAATQASDAHKSEFLNVLSHELRNPLAPLRSAVYVLEHVDAGAESAQRARAIIGRQVEHLARLVDDLLDSTRISTGKVHLRRAHLDLVDVVRRTVEDHRAVFQRGGVELALALPGRPLWADADETRIAQVVGNLLSNALKFTSAGGHVAVSLDLEPPWTAALRVRDDGVGMSPETLARLFDPFAQGAETLERSHAGLGLGLSLARGLVELHGGAILARSEGPGRGAELIVRLPLAGPVDATSAAPGAEGGAAVAHRRVLVIDDNRDAAESLGDLLRASGHAVEVAFDGPSGLALALAHPPDVLLCDIGLPGMSGYEVALACRAAPELARTLLVAVTGFGSAEDHRRALAGGFHHHLVKPVELSALAQLLREGPPVSPSRAEPPPGA